MLHRFGFYIAAFWYSVSFWVSTLIYIAIYNVFYFSYYYNHNEKNKTIQFKN